MFEKNKLSIKSNGSVVLLLKYNYGGYYSEYLSSFLVINQIDVSIGEMPLGFNIV